MEILGVVCGIVLSISYEWENNLYMEARYVHICDSVVINQLKTYTTETERKLGYVE